MKVIQTKDTVVLVMTPDEFQMTRALSGAGAGDGDYEQAYCFTKKERLLCRRVQNWWRLAAAKNVKEGYGS